MKRLDQGHLHEVLGLPCPTRESIRAFSVGGEHSRKEPFEQLFNIFLSAYSLFFLRTRRICRKYLSAYGECAESI
jgi:hypothetical protein